MTQDFRFRGPLQAVVFDWAGTLVDFGSFAPTQVLIEAFEGFGVAVSLDEARQPMGLAKWDHIQALGRLPGVEARWRERHGRAMTPTDVDALYAAFLPLQLERVAQYSEAIEGVPALLAKLRERGLRLGSCSGYPRAVMARLLPHAAERGVAPEHAVATDDLPAGGRPGPWMVLDNLLKLGVGHVAAAVKVDDTAPGIAEGLAAGCWTVGLALSGNEAGLTQAEFNAMDGAERAQRRGPAAERLWQAGAHYVVDTVLDLPGVLDQIEARLRRGERP